MRLKINKFNILHQNGKTTQYVAVAFSILVVALLSLSVFSFLGARNVQVNYNNLVSDALVKLEVISNLNQNEDATYNAALAHLITADPLLKHRYEKEIEQKELLSQKCIAQLDSMLQDPLRRNILEHFTQERERYRQQLNTLLTYSRQGKVQKSHQFNNEVLTPAYQAHHEQLAALSGNIRESMRLSGNDTVGAISNAVNNFSLAFVLAFLASSVSAVLIMRVLKSLKKDNQLLMAEIQERQQLEKALSESQRQYKMLFDNNPLPMWLFDQHTFNFLEVNDAAIKEYGYTREEFLATTILDIHPIEDASHVLHKLSRANRWGTEAGSWKHKRKDGTVFPVETRSHTMPEQGKYHPRLVAAMNVEDRLRATEMLARSEKQLREVSSSIPGAVFQLHRDGKMGFTFTFISEGISRLSGRTPTEILNDPQVLFNSMHEADRRSIKLAFRRSFKAIVPLVAEYRQWQPELNKWTWIRVHGLPTFKQAGEVIWNGTLIDITRQKEAQDKLATSEANLRALLDSSPQAIYLLNQDLEVILFNAVAASEVKKYLLKELQTGESILHFINPDQVQDIVENHAKALQGNTVIYEAGRGDYWHEVAFRPVVGPDKKVLAVSLSILDISDQKQVLETIRRNEAQLARAHHLAHLGGWEYDIERDLLSWADETYTIYGMFKEEFRPTFHNVMQLIHPADRELVQQEYDKALAERSLLQVEHRITLPDNTERILFEIAETICDEDGKAIKMSGSVQDITERKKTEREVREAKNLLQSTLENIPEIIFSAGEDSKLNYVSPQCRELTGYHEEEFLNDPALWYAIIFEEDRRHLTDQIFPNLILGQRQQCELRIIRRDGEARWFLLRLSPLMSEEGKVIRIDGSASDLTQYKIAETKRNELTDELLKQNQNLQQFAYIVSHNLRAPIANILGLTSIYNKKDSNDLLNHKVIDNLYKSANLLDSTIRDLNDILTIRSELGKVREDLSFQHVLEGVMDSVSDKIEESGSTIEHDFTEAPVVKAVRSYVHSIMLNLVTNALKYRSPERKLQLKLKTFLLPNYICLSVSDNGLGIDLEKEKDKVFGLYKRFHPNTEGKGVGLHLVKTQAELLGGKVEVESQLNRGTTFNIYFKN